MQQYKGYVIGALSLALFATATNAAAIERQPKEEQPLVRECHQQAMQSPAKEELAHKELKDSNFPDYVPGEEYELRLSFLGHGNTFHNVTCHVDEQGNVTYQEVEQNGLPSVQSDDSGEES
ncbi:hypothetical protein GCM10027040_02100 [Halomonas shantousis]